MDSILDAERTWRDFCLDNAGVEDIEHNTSCYVRINPDIGREPPSLDEVGEMESLQAETRNILQQPQSHEKLERVAHILIASSFYYEQTSDPRVDAHGLFLCSGKLA